MMQWRGIIVADARSHLHVADLRCRPRADRGHQTTFALRFQRDGGTRPTCIAELLFRRYEPEAT